MKFYRQGLTLEVCSLGWTPVLSCLPALVSGMLQLRTPGCINRLECKARRPADLSLPGSGDLPVKEGKGNDVKLWSV